jgi:RNA polymerase sigma-70 factor (ECF subfamily)
VKVDAAALSDQWLVDRITAVAARRDRAAFSDLFHHLAPRFKTFALRAGVTHQQAEELAQETMLMIWRKAASFEPGRAAPMAWLFAIARNKRADLFRRASPAHADLGETPEHADDEQYGPEEAFRAGRARDLVQQAMTALSPEQRVVVEKAFMEDKSHADVASELALPLGTVKSRIRLALSRMRDELPADRP